MIRKAEIQDSRTLALLAVQMWDDNTVEELEHEFEELIRSEDTACFIKYEGSEPVGFAQCSLRHDYVEGTKSSPAGYLEGIFTAEAARKRGYAKELLLSCEEWAKTKHCTEFASDCELDNEESLKFHLAAGFEETNRIICFKRKLV